jgi:uncharacterized membrane protein
VKTPQAPILLAPPSPLGLMLGAAGFLAALTPSMIPRPVVLQGVEAGIAFALLYGLGTGTAALWSWLEAPVPFKRYSRAFLWAAIVLCLAIVGYGLARETGWQNGIRRVMGMPAVPAGLPVLIAIVGVPVAVLLIGLARLFNAFAKLVSARLAKLIPRRVALLVGFAVAAALFWTIGNGLLLRTALHELDSSYRHIDALMPTELSAPDDPLKSGSGKSLVSWGSLGAQGRERVVAAPSKSDIAALTTGPGMEPLRVYVGLNSAQTVQQRAELALAELKRVRAFDRAAVVIATPTGTGWVDPSGMAPLEILYRGDVASVSVQYSYLPSWLSLMVEPDYGADTARAVFRVVYDYWRTLPKERRPRLYLFGLSLGARNSDLSADVFDVIADPYQGALWVGPPWDSETWRRVTAMRAAGSPVWLPRFRDESLFHFTTQRNELNGTEARWGPMRMVFLQYPSDPIVFFESAGLWRPPSWMQQRAPDVAPEIRWMPVVTFVQQICDMMTATTTPRGVGHVYAGAHYLDGWIAVTEPQGWNEESLARLREWLKAHDL